MAGTGVERSCAARKSHPHRSIMPFVSSADISTYT